MSSTAPKVNKKIKKSDNVQKYKRIDSKSSQMVKHEISSGVPLDWAKFTDFRSRNSREDLERLFSGMDGSRVKKICETPDESGLSPIHWAAIHNRSDLLKPMIERGGVSLDLPCRNKLFADGTALHLAAMNGSLEVASLILDDHGKQKEDNQKDNNNNNNMNSPKPNNNDDTRSSLLKMRDSEGQTALMRSAAPRSKRLNTIWDLLRKNLWSLSGRPSEVALFMICHGADWRETEPTNGMNLMHLAIVNDYDDIVNLLLVIDKDLLTIPTANYKQLSGRNKEVKTIKTIKQAPPEAEQSKPKQVSSLEFETINLRDDTSSEGSTSSSASSSSSAASSRPKTPSSEPLLDRQTRTERLMSKGLQPLQLAILYGRVAIIGLLWYATFQRDQPIGSPTIMASHQETPGHELQRQAMREHSRSSKELKQILINACWNNKDELARFIKTSALKAVLALDLALLALVWAPTYASSADDESSSSTVDEDNGQVTARSLRGGLFILSYCVSLALALRVMLKNPGYLRRNSVQYLKEMSSLIASKTSTTATKKTSGSSPQPTDKQQQQSHTPPPTSLTPIRRDDNRTGQTAAAAAYRQQQQQQQVTLAMANELPNWQEQFDDLKDKVRLLCHKCRCIRRPRSKHCNYCNHCVQDFDHHCIYLGCCIGRNNRLDFLLTLISLSITSIYGTLIHSFNSTGWPRFWRSVGLIWILKYALVGVLSAFLNLKRACQGVTLFESIRSRRIRSIFGPGGPSEAISKSHRAYSTLKGSYWRYEPDVYLSGELGVKAIAGNLDDFSQSMSCDEYLLMLACGDTSLARALLSSDTRINKYKFVN